MISEDGASGDDALALAHRIAREVSRPVELDVGTTVRPRASIGVAIRSPEVPTAETLLIDADLAMYQAKRERLTVVVADRSLRESVVRRCIVERDIRAALEAGELGYHYQPVYDLLTGEVLGVEALMRWEHPELGWIPPPEVLDCVDRLAMTELFTARSIDRIGAELSCLRRELPSFGDKQFSVNLSARQLGWTSYVDTHMQTLERYGLRVDDVIIEVTESSAIEVGNAAENTLRRLGDLGVTLALDDFGVGFNALSYFTRFAVHALKIDRSLVAAAVSERPAAAIVQSLVELGKQLDVVVVAEGIETVEEAETCVGLGVRTGQGFLFGAAVPMAELVERGTDGSAWGFARAAAQPG